MGYDSTADTLLHIKRVNCLLLRCVKTLLNRAAVHDNSKLEEPEKSEFDRLTPKLKELTYGSLEYKDSLKELQGALQHHYEHNSHHPEYYGNGVAGMDLFDIIEMLMDWKAATERTKDGDILKSIELNRDRFKLSPQLVEILTNTVISMGLFNKEV
jgi:hypothetical protein